jgi:hypothetical protein
MFDLAQKIEKKVFLRLCIRRQQHKSNETEKTSEIVKKIVKQIVDMISASHSLKSICVQPISP